MLNEDICDTMVKMAKDARQKAYSPYSNIKVGACILASDGTLYGACNVENGSSSLSVCAERAAVYKAISDGKQEFDANAISENNNPATGIATLRNNAVKSEAAYDLNGRQLKAQKKGVVIQNGKKIIMK